MNTYNYSLILRVSRVFIHIYHWRKKNTTHSLLLRPGIISFYSSQHSFRVLHSYTWGLSFSLCLFLFFLEAKNQAFIQDAEHSASKPRVPRHNSLDVIQDDDWSKRSIVSHLPLLLHCLCFKREGHVFGWSKEQKIKAEIIDSITMLVKSFFVS